MARDKHSEYRPDSCTTTYMHRNFMCRYNFTKCGNFIGRRKEWEKEAKAAGKESPLLYDQTLKSHVGGRWRRRRSIRCHFTAKLQGNYFIYYCERRALHGNSRLYGSIWAKLVDLYLRLFAGIDVQLTLELNWNWPDGDSVIMMKVINLE